MIKLLRNQHKYIESLNSLVLYSKGTIKTLDLEISTNMIEFVTSNSVGIVDELTNFSFQIYKTISLPMLVLFIDPSKADHYQYLNMLEKVARDY